MSVGPHSFNQGAWHNCMRCERKTKLSALTWQRGVLLCRTCLDPWPLTGQREVAIAQVLMDGKQEFQVDPKLAEPVIEDDILYL